LSQKAGMSNPENATSSIPASSPPLRTWDFAETTLVGLIAYAVFGLTGGLTSAIVLAMYGEAHPLPPAQFQADGASYIVACPFTVAVLWYAIRMARREFAEYLALNWPSAGELLRALVITIILLLIQVLTISAVGPTEIFSNPYVNANWGLLTFLVGSCIAVPIMEEFVVRGFMFRGWSQSFLGPLGAIVLSSILWASLHTQYDWFGRFWIFVTGLVLGHFRWRSNSTWLTVMAHSVTNTVILFAVGLYP
jgi:membrane protease YdiL (CAAX protease family)